MSVRKRYLGVGVGWNCSFNLHRESMDYLSVRWWHSIYTIFWHSEGVVLLPALTLAVLDEGQLNELMSHERGSHQLHMMKRMALNCNYSLFLLMQVGQKCMTEHIPPRWECAWARERTPALRRHSSRHIASMTRRMGQRDGASPPATPAKPPPECPEAHNRSVSKLLTTAVLTERQMSQHRRYFIYQLLKVVQNVFLKKKQGAYLLDLPWILESLLAASERAGGGHRSNEKVHGEHCFNEFSVSRAEWPAR